MSPSTTTIPEEYDGGAAEEGEGNTENRVEGTPVTVVHPPSPELKGRELPTPPPDER